jgi:hypothetical protein
MDAEVDQGATTDFVGAALESRGPFFSGRVIDIFAMYQKSWV